MSNLHGTRIWDTVQFDCSAHPWLKYGLTAWDPGGSKEFRLNPKSWSVSPEIISGRDLIFDLT